MYICLNESNRRWAAPGLIKEGLCFCIRFELSPPGKQQEKNEKTNYQTLAMRSRTDTFRRNVVGYPPRVRR